jgi:hypothetical protein
MFPSSADYFCAYVSVTVQNQFQIYIYIYISIFYVVMAKAALNKKKTLFTSKMDLHLRKKLVKFYI